MTTVAALKRAIDDLLNHREATVDEAMDRHFGPTFRQCTNGVWAERPEVRARISQLRAQTHGATVTVLDEMVDGARYAERHRIALAMRDGTRRVLEVHVFARRDADGRFAEIEEATVALGP